MRALGIVGFIRARPGGRFVHLGSLGSFGRGLEVVGIIHERPESRSVHSGAFFRWFGLVGFIRGRHRSRSVHSGAHLGSFGIVGFIREWPARGYVHFCWLGSFGGVQGVDVFILARPWGRSVHLSVPLGLWVHSGALLCRCVISGVPCQSLGSLWFVAFIRARRIHLGTFLRAPTVVGFIGMVGFIRARPGGGSVYLSTLWRSSVSFGFVGFIRARRGGHRVHFGSFGRALGIVGFIWVRPAYGRVNFCSFVRVLCFVGVIRARAGGSWIDSGVPWGSFGRAVGVLSGVALGFVGLISVRWVH